MEIIADRAGSVGPDVTTTISIGAYDGIHLGHQLVIDQVKRRAAELGTATGIVTFDRHPALVLRPENAPKLLTTLEQRLDLIAAAGIDFVYLVEFDLERSRTTAEQFVSEVFVDALHARSVVVGADFHFGQGRSGDVDALRVFGERYGFDVTGLDLIRPDADALEPVSSTAIRRALAGGEVARAADLLGRYYEIRGEVIMGDQRGRTIGFPTANIPVDQRMAWPADGVYAGWFHRQNGERHGTAMNIGRRPTFYQHAEHSVLEAHLLDFEGDLYGEQVRVEFVDFLRSEQRFSGIDALAEQLKRDVEHARSVLGC
jgi:riboflavin kinase/FMN adenylyltransferase